MGIFRGRTKGSYTIDVVLILILLILGYLYIAKRVDPGVKRELEVYAPENKEAFFKAHDEGGVVEPQNIPQGVSDWDVGAANRRYQMADPQHDARLKNVPDTRPKGCKTAYGDLGPVKVSIVVTFHEFQYYDMKTTVNSVLLNTDPFLLKEVIVIDDYSSQDFIKNDVDVFSQVARFVRLIRMDERRGQVMAMLKGFREAKSDIVVYLQPGVIVNKDWLPPLIATLQEKPETVVTPHYDHVSDPITYEYHETPHNLTPIFTWGLAIRMAQVDRTLAEAGQTVPSVVLRGSTFAIKKDFLLKIGSFDDRFEDMEEGGEMLEFSFRVWRCGGVILEAPCSRVGVLNLHDPVKIVSHRNMRRVVELWMRTKGDMIYHSTGTSANVPKAEQLSIDQRKKYISKLTCKDVEWYMKTIAKYVPQVKESTLKIGVLRVKTSSCVSISPEGGKLLLDGCPKVMSERKSVFEFLKNGQIYGAGRCLSSQGNNYVLLVECKEGDNTQLWEHTDNGEIISRDNKGCAMHVTDPDKSKDRRQIVMTQDCRLDTEGTFKTWQFVPV